MMINLKFFVSLVFVLISFNVVFSVFNVCHTTIDEPWLLINDSFGNDLLIIDHDGDAFVKGFPVNSYDAGLVESEDALQIGGLYFEKSEAYMKNVVEESLLVAGVNGTIIKNNLGDDVAFIDSNGLMLKGEAIFNNSQAGCLSDGFYCNATVLENRDYFCQILGDKSGECRYENSSAQDCLLTSSEETDSGDDHAVYGEVKDYTGCDISLPNGLQNCTYTLSQDYCTGDDLTEFFSTGYGVDNVIKTCTDENSFYCDGVVRKEIVYGCENPGQCEITNPARVVETCIAPPNSVSWGCTGTSRRRTTVSYSPTCSGSACGVSSSTTTDYFACPGGQTCSAGSCVPVNVNLALGRYSHSWTYNSHLNPHGNWHGLTSGVIPGNNAETQTGVMWASSSGSTSWSDKWVSVDLAGGTRTVRSIRVYDEHSPDAGTLCGGAQDNTRTIQVYTKTGSNCAWNSGSWVHRGTWTAPQGSATSKTFNFGAGVAANCVRLKFDNTWGNWRTCNCWDCDNYAFLKELQVWGY